MNRETHHGIVIAKHRRHCIVETGDGELVSCASRSRTADAICGDRVQWQADNEGRGIITAIETRRTLLSRPDMRSRARNIAANIDRLIIVSAVPRDSEATPAFNLDLVDSYLVAAEIMGISPLILANKVDLLPSGADAALDALAEYRRLDYNVIATSTKSEHGLDSLLEQLQGVTSVFVGESGVGKSSLIKRLLPEQDIRVGAVSEATGLGRHTTSTATLYHLPGQGGDIIDSPGVRDFSLWHIEEEQLRRGFREFIPLLGECRFRNCRHTGEKGCAMEQAVTNGAISARRLQSYRNLLTALENDRR